MTLTILTSVIVVLLLFILRYLISLRRAINRMKRAMSLEMQEQRKLMRNDISGGRDKRVIGLAKSE